MNGETVLVTGGAGFVGSHLTEALLERGARVRVLDSYVEQAHRDTSEGLPPDVEIFRGDVRDRAVLDRALSGATVVYHLAAEVGIGQSMCEIDRYVNANSGGSASLLQALLERRGELRKLVVASSVTIYGEGAYRCKECGPAAPSLRTAAQLELRYWEPFCAQCGAELEAVPTPEEKPQAPGSVYAITKQSQELLALAIGRAYAIPTVALRFSNIYGPRQALSNPYTGVAAIFAARLLGGQRPILFEDGKQLRDFTHVRDIVQALVRAADSPAADYHAINVGTGEGTSLRTLAGWMAEGLGVDLEPEATGRYRAGDIRHCFSDISRARKLLGYEPTVSLRQGMAEYVTWVRDRRARIDLEQGNNELLARGLVR